MTDDTATLSPIDRMRTTPADVPDSIERVARIKALQGWLADLEKPVRAWLEAKADEVESMTGSAFKTEAKGIGSAYLSDPQPTPRISDQEAFARWYVTAVLDADPDEEHDGSHTVQFDERVLRRITADADAADLLAFLDVRAGVPDRAAEAAEALANRIRVDEEWLIGESVLEDMIAGKWRAIAEDKPRLRLDKERLHVVDLATGETVPGVTVNPAGKRVLTVTPDKQIKAELRDELRTLLGPPALTDGD